MISTVKGKERRKIRKKKRRRRSVCRAALLRRELPRLEIGALLHQGHRSVLGKVPPPPGSLAPKDHPVREDELISLLWRGADTSSKIKI
jgi:hypothetical protein